MRLQTRVAISFVPLAILIGVGTPLLLRGTVRDTLINNLCRRAIDRAGKMAALVVPGLSHRNERVLFPALKAIEDQTMATYVVPRDDKGHMIAQTKTSNLPEKPVNHSIKITMKEDTLRRQFIETGRDTLVDLSMPVWEIIPWTRGEHSGRARKQLGTLHIGLPLTDLMQSTETMWDQLELVFISVMAVTLLGALIILRQILTPIRKLAWAFQQIRQGARGINVPVDRTDELGDLAREFNTMSKELAETTVSKDFVTGVLDNMVGMLFVLGPDNKIMATNRVALQRLKWPEKELLGQTAQFLMPKEEWPGMGQLFFEMVRREGSIKNVDSQFLTSEGEAFPVLISGTRFVRESPGTDDIILVANDMTDRSQWEKEIVQSEKMVAVGRLASGVAHEINNPLGVILCFAQGMSERLKPNDPFIKPLKAIERETHRCKSLVQNLLAFSRQSPSAMEIVNVNSSIEAALTLVSAQTRMGRIILKNDFLPALPPVRGNGNQLQQVIINLSNNALDAMGEEGTLTIATKVVQEKGRSWVEIVVTDTGPGIPKSVLPRIFEPFFTTKPVGKGTGLGLALVHDIIEKHNGSIRIKTEPGHTDFIIHLPVLSVPDEKPSKAA